MKKEDQLVNTLLRSPVFQQLFDLAEKIPYPNWYVAGGSVTQTVWNDLTGRPWDHGLKDLDIVYFDAAEPEQENHQLQHEELFSTLPLPVDLNNQAEVHKWYGKKFGYEIPAYSSCEEGVSTWLPAFAVGVNKTQESYHIFAPYGLEDLFAMNVRPNKKQITPAIYQKMVERLKKDWPEISVEPWELSASNSPSKEAR